MTKAVLTSMALWLMALDVSGCGESDGSGELRLFVGDPQVEVHFFDASDDYIESATPETDGQVPAPQAAIGGSFTIDMGGGLWRSVSAVQARSYYFYFPQDSGTALGELVFAHNATIPPNSEIELISSCGGALVDANDSKQFEPIAVNENCLVDGKVEYIFGVYRQGVKAVAAGSVAPPDNGATVRVTIPVAKDGNTKTIRAQSPGLRVSARTWLGGQTYSWGSGEDEISFPQPDVFPSSGFSVVEFWEENGASERGISLHNPGPPTEDGISRNDMLGFLSAPEVDPIARTVSVTMINPPREGAISITLSLMRDGETTDWLVHTEEFSVDGTRLTLQLPPFVDVDRYELATQPQEFYVSTGQRPFEADRRYESEGRISYTAWYD